MADISALAAVSDVAHELGYTVQHVRRLVREGRLNGSKVGRDWLVERESVRRYGARKANLSLKLAARRGRWEGRNS